MCVTAFISMWINNSAATSIMLPVAAAIVDQLENYDRQIPSDARPPPDIVDVDTASKRTAVASDLSEANV